MPNPAQSGFTTEEMAELTTGGNDALDAGGETESGGGDTTPANDNTVTEQTTTTDAGTARTRPPAGFVPQESLHEARARIKEEKARADKYEATFQRFMERANAPATGDKKPEAQIPDFNTDPVGNLEARLRASEQRAEAAEKDRTARTQAEQQQGQTNELLNKYAGAVRSFKRTAPDYDAAYQYVADWRDKELETLGYSDPADRANRLQYEEGMIVGKALMDGKDPAKLLYDYAVMRGYKAAANDNKLDRLTKGQQAARTLNGGKPPNDGAMTLDKLSELYDSDPDEADKMFAKMKRAGQLG